MAERKNSPRDMALSYVLPIRAAAPNVSPELIDYLRWLSTRAETIVVDGSDPATYAIHERAWGSLVRHVPPDPTLVTPMGKVGGVLTGLRLASHEKLIVADDDIRYDERSLAQVAEALDRAEVVRPQNFFSPLPWHARWDTSRMLLNRVAGGDWPGTLGVRRSALIDAGGYDGRAMFENLELVRTIRALGGREEVLLDAYVLPGRARRGTSGRSGCARRTTRSPGPGASRSSSPCSQRPFSAQGASPAGSGKRTGAECIGLGARSITRSRDDFGHQSCA